MAYKFASWIEKNTIGDAWPNKEHLKNHLSLKLMS